MRHLVTSIFNAAMGDTLIQVAMYISNDNGMLKIWYESQVIVGCRGIIMGRNTIFVGDKYSTIDAITSLIQLKNQWKDYMDSVLQLVSVNSEPDS